MTGVGPSGQVRDSRCGAGVISSISILTNGHMRKLSILTLIAAALVLTGQSCLPPPPEQEPVDETPPPISGPRLLTADGQPVPDDTIRKTHVVGRSPCPDPFEPVIIDPGEGVEGECTLTPEDLPEWVDVVEDEAVSPIGRGIVLGLEFNCNIADRSTHNVEVTAGFALDCMGNEILVAGDHIDINLALDVLTKADADKRDE